MEENKKEVEVESLFGENETKVAAETPAAIPQAQEEVQPVNEVPNTVENSANTTTPQVEVPQPEVAPVAPTSNPEPVPAEPSVAAPVTTPVEPPKPENKNSKKEKIELVIFVILVIIFVALLLKTFVFTGNDEKEQPKEDNTPTEQTPTGISDSELLTLGKTLYERVNGLFLISNTAVGCKETDELPAHVVGEKKYGKVSYADYLNYVTSEYDTKLRSALDIIVEETTYYAVCPEEELVANPNYKTSTFEITDKTNDMATFHVIASFCGCGEDGNFNCDITTESDTTMVIKKVDGNWKVDQMTPIQQSSCNGVIDPFA